MISDLVAIEHFFGRLEAVMTLEDLIRTYGPEAVRDAIEAQDLELRRTLRDVYALVTDQARLRCCQPAALMPQRFDLFPPGKS